jgi:YggT family protein
MMLQDALQFLLRIVCELAATAFWLRFYMQLNRLPYANSFAQFIVKVTDFAVRPIRRIIPGFFGLDWASLLLFFLAELLLTLGSHWLMGYPFMAATAQVWPGFLLFTLANGLGLIIYVFMGLIAVQAIISWVNPFSPAAPVFYALARPILRPFQRIIPPFNGIDLSPMAAFIVLQLLVIAPIAGLERYAHGLIW